MRHGDAPLVTGKGHSLPLAETVPFHVSNYRIKIGRSTAVVPVALVTLDVTGLFQLGQRALHRAAG